MNKSTKIGIAIMALVLIIIYFAVVVVFFMTQSLVVFKLWEILILISAPVVLLLLLALLTDTEYEKRGFAIASISFMICATVITSLAHYENIVSRELVAAKFQPGDPLAWGYFTGLAFLLGSMAISEDRRKRGMKRTLLVGGILCLLGLAGPITGIDPLWFIAVAGYGLGTPVLSVQLIKYNKSS